VRLPETITTTISITTTIIITIIIITIIIAVHSLFLRPLMPAIYTLYHNTDIPLQSTRRHSTDVTDYLTARLNSDNFLYEVTVVCKAQRFVSFCQSSSATGSNTGRVPDTTDVQWTVEPTDWFDGRG